MNSTQKKIISIWLYSGLLLVIAMVLIGGVTRLTHSGLSMVEWKLIGGIIPPLNETAWQETFSKYQQFPEYQKINKDMILSEFKAIFFWEYIHRVLGRLIGLVFIIPFLLFWKKQWLDKKLKKQLILLFLLGILQGFLGWFMVKSGLVDVPAVSHFRLAIHLVMAFVLIAYIYWIIMEVEEKEKFPSRKINNLVTCFIILLLIQIIYGAFTAGLKAGYLLPPNSNYFEKVFSYTIRDANNFSLLNNGFDIQAFHRLFAWILAIISFQTFKKTQHTNLRTEGRLLFFLVVFQIILGISTLLLRVQIHVAITHQVFAILVFLSAFRLLYLSTENSQ